MAGVNAGARYAAVDRRGNPCGCPFATPTRAPTRAPQRSSAKAIKNSPNLWQELPLKRKPDPAMLDRCDLEPLFFAPFVSSVMRVEPGWIDYNGHLNMAYYNVLFDRAVDEAYELLGIGAGYVESARCSLFTAEVHVRYLRELHAGDPVRVTFQLHRLRRQAAALFRAAVPRDRRLGIGDLREHVAACRHGGQEDRGLSPAVAVRLAKMAASHAMLPRPEAAGRRIAMPERS